jgi:hypothetical protein
MALNNLRVKLAESGRVLISFDPSVKGEPTQKGDKVILAGTGRWLGLGEFDASLEGMALNLVVTKKVVAATKKPAAKAAKEEEASGYDDMELPALKKAAKERSLKTLEIIKSAPNERMAAKRLRIALEEYDAENSEPEAKAEEDAVEYSKPTWTSVRDMVMNACDCAPNQGKMAKAVYDALCEEEYDWDTKPRQFKKDLKAKWEVVHGEPDAEEAVEREVADEDDEPATPKKAAGKKPVVKTTTRPADKLKAKRASK